MSKQILFRLKDDIATQLENKLSDKGITKQFLFNKVVELFLDDKLSLDSNIRGNDIPKIIIDSNEVAETIKKHYLNDLANLIAENSTLITLVAKSLKSNALSGVDNIDSKMITDDIQEPIIVEEETAELEEIETENKSLVSDSPLMEEKADTTSEKSADDKTAYRGFKGNNTSKEKTFDDTIARIKSLKSEGKSNGEIVKVLNNDGYPTKKGSQGKWRSNQVQSILKGHK